MAPLRRYLRITKHSILERPVLPDILAAVKPYVLPKLREENARAAGKKTGSVAGGTKPKGKKGVRDVVVSDSFEVSIFLTELSTPHAVLLRTRNFTGKGSDDGQTGTQNLPVVIREEDDDDENDDVQIVRQESGMSIDQDQRVKQEDTPSEMDAPDTRPGQQLDDAQSISSNEDEPVAEDDEKKKLGLQTNYEGFHIYGRILCLVVKRKGQLSTSTGRQRSNQNASGNATSGVQAQESVAEMVQRTASSAGQRDEGILEGWMRSTQIGNDNQGISGGGDMESDEEAA